MNSKLTVEHLESLNNKRNYIINHTQFKYLPDVTKHHILDYAYIDDGEILYNYWKGYLITVKIYLKEVDRILDIRYKKPDK